MNARILAWEGSRNVRDLGGLRLADGRLTRWQAIVRSDTPTRLTLAGWAALHAYGIRTIVTLRTDGLLETQLTVSTPYPEIDTLSVAIEDITDEEFVAKWVNSSLWGTPLYCADALRRWPQRQAAAFLAIARAQPGGVLFHCIRGFDRTGIIALLLLALAGVTPDEIAADYALSLDPERDKLLARRDSSVQAVLADTLAGLNLADYLPAGGATPADLIALRQRLVG